MKRLFLFVALLSTSCARKTGPATVLLFDGTGVSVNDVRAVEDLLNRDHLNYSLANSSELNRMSESQFQGYRLLIIPGGNFIHMGESLTSGSAAAIRKAVQNGVSYLGICAGALLAGDKLNLTDGVRFNFYSAERRGIRKAAVAVTDAASKTLDQYWEDGPELSGWGAVVGKYPDGTPAIVEGKFGNGWVILSGVHPEAPDYWRRGMNFATAASIDNNYAAMLIHAALDRTSLPHY